MTGILRDLRSAARALARRPVRTLMIVCILSAGLAASIGVFTYVNGFRQPFPGVDARGLVQLIGVDREDAFQDISYLDYLDYASGATGTLEGMSAAQAGYAASVRHEATTEVVFLEAVSGAFFPVLDVKISAGRALTVDDDRPGAEPVAVISHGWWQRQWNGDPSVIGSVVHFNFRPYTVVGVADPEFRGSLASYRPDAWLPLEPFKDRYTGWATASENRDLPLIRVHARLRAGTTLERARAELEGVAAGLDAAYPRAAGNPRRVAVAPVTWIDPRARAAESSEIRMMIAGALGLFLLVCANVGSLLLTAGAERKREMAMRAALGASRLQLVRQVVAESAILSVVAGVAGFVLAVPASARLGSYFARPSVWGANVAREATLDAGVVMFGVAVTLVACVLAGLLPALQVSRRNVADVLKSEAGTASDPPAGAFGRRIPGTRAILLSAQVALTVVLLSVAGVVLESMRVVADLDPGFEYPSILASYISTSSTGVTVPERDLYFRTLAARLAEEPWVRSASISDQAPLSPHGAGPLRMEGVAEEPNIVQSRVIPGFFETMGMAVIGGRAFTETDTLGAPGVAVVNRALADRFYSGINPVGRRLWWAGSEGVDDRSFEIVGIVTDARVRDLLIDPEPVVYFAYPQHSYASGSALVVATREDPAAAVPLLERWLRNYEGHIAIVNILPYTEVMKGFTYTQRMNAEMFSALALPG
ncbi:MAG: ABC transporter permease, partial [Gemmatimonadota bacterium]|nr:ABC transporter permease [Gemmatimonadota bacterium]